MSSNGDDSYGDDAYANDGYVAAYGDDDAYNDDAYNDDGKEEGGQYNQYDDSDPLDILAYSEACSIELFGSACPDPFGIKNGYESALGRALKKSRSSAFGGGRMQPMQLASLVLLALGAVLFVAAFIVRKRSSERSISDKDDALMASTPSKKPRRATRDRKSLREKFQNYSKKEVADDAVVDSPSKDDSYIHLNNDSPTEEDEPTPIPSPEKPAVSHSASASATTSEPTSDTTGRKKKKRQWLNKFSKT